MSQQEWLKEPKASMYDQLLAVDGVTEVEMFDFESGGCGVYVKGGSDADIADAMAMHTYSWNVRWFVGDISVTKEFFTSWFYRDYNTFTSKFEELKSE